MEKLSFCVPFALLCPASLTNLECQIPGEGHPELPQEWLFYAHQTLGCHKGCLPCPCTFCKAGIAFHLGSAGLQKGHTAVRPQALACHCSLQWQWPLTGSTELGLFVSLSEP